jgi:hypothetical protein
MSVCVTTLVLSKKLGSPARKFIAAKLADGAGDEGFGVLPTIAGLAAELEISEHEARGVVSALRDEGLLHFPETANCPMTRVKYRLDLDAIRKLPNVGAAETRGMPA